MKPLIDISYWQNPALFDYDRVANAISGAIIRCSYGSKYDYPYGKETAYPTHYAELHSRGVPLGVYIFLTQYQPVANQVRTLVEAIQGKEFKLGVWLDVENEAGASPLTRQQVHAFMQQAEAELGYPLGIYTSKSQWAAIMGGVYYNTRKLWVAHYGVDNPLLPAGWNSYVLHQYAGSATGRIDGYPGGIDCNRFNGTQAQFDAWVSGEETPDPIVYPPLTKLYYPCKEEESYITQYFGERPSVYPASHGHNGIDFGFNYQVGKDIYAAEAGVVEVAREDTYGYGRHVRIRHSHGITIYGHLSQRFVNVGDQVEAKQLIGLSGGHPSDPYAGFSSGPHLHFEYRWDIPAPQVPGGFTYNAVDPLPLLVSHQEDAPMLYRVEVICNALNKRSGPGVGYVVRGVARRGDEFDVYEEQNDWLRIGVGLWVCGLPAYVKRVAPVGPSVEERVSALEERVAALEDAQAA